MREYPGPLALIRHGINYPTYECIVVGHKDRPKVRINKKKMTASRGAWFMAYGDPGDSYVLHTCHNEQCVNILHLYLGDHKQNMKDKVDANRCNNPKGQDHYNAKLTDHMVRQIRKEYTGKWGEQTRLAAKYGISTPTINRVLRGKDWTHVQT